MLRPAAEPDVPSIRSWRNQEINRSVSLSTAEITPEQHAAWWSSVTTDPSRQVLVLEYDGRALGVVTFFDLDLDADPRTGSWGFFLDHDTAVAEGITVPVWLRLMVEADAWAFDVLGLDELHGHVLAGNDAVRAMNKRFGFREGEPEVAPDGRTFYPISLRRSDRRTSRRATT